MENCEAMTSSTLICIFISTNTGANPGFSLGGGGGGGAQKIMCPRAHYERGTELTFGRGCFNAACSCQLSSAI